MIPGNKAVITATLIALPLLVAAFDISLLPTILLLAGLLVWLWLNSLSGLLRRDADPKLVLDTISMSHFAEKARWCLDRLGVDYHEHKSNGLLGVIFTGRTVPRLRFRSGVVESSIGHSPEILRFLWGEYGVRLAEDAAFLEPICDTHDPCLVHVRRGLSACFAQQVFDRTNHICLWPHGCVRRLHSRWLHHWGNARDANILWQE